MLGAGGHALPLPHSGSPLDLHHAIHNNDCAHAGDTSIKPGHPDGKGVDRRLFFPMPRCRTSSSEHQLIALRAQAEKKRSMCWDASGAEGSV